MSELMAAFGCAGNKAVVTEIVFEQKDFSDKVRCRLLRYHRDSQPSDKIYIWTGFVFFFDT